jgi:TolA-binding protein
LDSLELQLRAAQDVKKTAGEAQLFVEKATAYATAFPQDSTAADWLFKAADVSRGLGEFGKAIQLWGKVWREFPDNEKAPDALFLQGFTYDSNLQDATNASRYYKRFLETYPDHPYVPEVEKLLAVINTDPDELIKEFEKNRKK